MAKYLLIVFILSSCYYYSPSTPEEYITHKNNISINDIDIMIQTGFDFQSENSQGDVYLKFLFSHSNPKTLEILKLLLKRNIINPKTIFTDNNTLLNYVVSNPGDIALDMAMLLLESENREFFLKSPKNPLINAINNPSKIHWSLIWYLINQGFSINQKDPETGVTPALEFFKNYTDTETKDISEYFLKHTNIHIVDKEKKNLWHYIFTNTSKNIQLFTKYFYSQYATKAQIVLPDKAGVYPIYILASNSMPEIYTIFSKIYPMHTALAKNTSWVNNLLFSVLKNNGSSLTPLFNYSNKLGPQISAKTPQGQSTLIVAVQNTSKQVLPIIQYLLKQRVNFYTLDSRGLGALNYAVQNTGKYGKEILKILAAEGMALDTQDKYKKTLLSYVVKNQGPSATDMFDLLLSEKIPSTIPDIDGYTPLELLLENPSPESINMLRALIFSSYQGKYQEFYSRDIILKAAQSQSPYAYKMLLTLIQQGFPLQAQNDDKQNALFYAVQNPGPQAIEMAQLLLQKGLNSGSIDRDGNTLLIYASKNKEHRFSMVDLLLRWGVSPTRKNIEGISFIDYINKLPQPREKWRYSQILTKYDMILEG